MDQIELRAGRLFRENGIIHLILAPATELENDDIDQVFLAVRRLNGSDDYFVLVDATDVIASPNEVRNYAAVHPDAKFVKACGIVSNSLAAKLIINFFLNFNKPVYPTRMFTSHEGATEWISTMMCPVKSSTD